MAYKYKDQPVKRLEKLSPKEQERLLFDLINAFSLVKSTEEAALFIQDILTLSEVKVIAKRLAVARLLLDDYTYEEIRRELRVGQGMIAKVSAWLAEKGEGFRRIIKRLPEPEEFTKWWEKTDWERLRDSYPRYFWPLSSPETAKKQGIKRRKKLLRGLRKNLELKEKVREGVQERLDEQYRR